MTDELSGQLQISMKYARVIIRLTSCVTRGKASETAVKTGSKSGTNLTLIAVSSPHLSRSLQVLKHKGLYLLELVRDRIPTYSRPTR